MTKYSPTAGHSTKFVHETVYSFIHKGSKLDAAQMPTDLWVDT